MYIHKTNGTIGYLQDVKDKYPNSYLQANANTAVLYYEDDNETSVFETDNSYEVLNSNGELDENHTTFIVHIPAYGLGKSTIISHLGDFQRELDNIRGVKSYRIGSKVDQESYLVLISFVEVSAYHDFKKTDTFSKYLSQESLKKFQNEESMFQDFATSQAFFPIKEVEQDEDEF